MACRHRPGTGGGNKADDYIARQRKFDSDLWVIEIEDQGGRHFLDEPVSQI